VYWAGDYYYSDGTNWVQMSGGGGSVTNVTATTPLSSTGGTTPDISISQSDSTTDGYLSSTDWNTFNNKQDALGFTPEDVANKSDSYTASSSITYASTKALVDGINSTYTPRVQTITSASTVTPTSANDEVTITAQAVVLTLANPSGTPSEGQAMTIRIKDNGTSQTIAYGSQYRVMGVSLPANTTVSKTLYLGLIYNATDTKWDVVGVSLEGSDPYTGSDWIDYSASSTIVGWSTFTTKKIKYRIIGKQVFVAFQLDGISNSTSTTFTLPYANASGFETNITIRYINNGVGSGSPGLVQLTNTSSTVIIYTGLTGGTWVASGTKTVFGQFFYEIS
jgi:hypothetical protein